MEPRERILQIVTCNTKLSFIDAPIDENHIMYVYGDAASFDDIVSDIEDEFGSILLSPLGKDIGEMTVKEFVDGIVESLPSESEEECCICDTDDDINRDTGFICESCVEKLRIIGAIETISESGN